MYVNRTSEMQTWSHLSLNLRGRILCNRVKLARWFGSPSIGLETNNVSLFQDILLETISSKLFHALNSRHIFTMCKQRNNGSMEWKDPVHVAP
jgi:hypothetical protein